MATKNKTPVGLSWEQIARRFSTEETARAYLESQRWPDGAICPHCGVVGGKVYKIEPNPAKNIRAGLYDCGECHKQFTVTVGTIFEDSHIPLHKWLWAIYEMCTDKNGVSALEIQRKLEIGSYRSAWHMMHRIRHALRDPVFAGPKFTGVIEADETYIGGKQRGGRRGRPGKSSNKTAVFAVLQRSGRVRPVVVPRVTAKNLKAVLTETVDPSARLMTDELATYKPIGREFASHESVQHNIDQYTKPGEHDELVTTNSLEGFFGNMKRGISGTHHSISRQHLPLYLAEHEFRFNEREVTDGERTVKAIGKVAGKRLMLKAPKTAAR